MCLKDTLHGFCDVRCICIFKQDTFGPAQVVIYYYEKVVFTGNLQLVNGAVTNGTGNVVDLIDSVLLLEPTSWQGCPAFTNCLTLLFHVAPPNLFSEAGLCACHILVTLMCEFISMLPEAFRHDSTVTSKEKLVLLPNLCTLCPISDPSLLS